eukprot:2640812-Prymnesium_polylepis.1
MNGPDRGTGGHSAARWRPQHPPDPPPSSDGIDLHSEDMQGGKWGVMRGFGCCGWPQSDE